MNRVHARIALSFALVLVGCEPTLPIVQRPATVVQGLTRADAQSALDSIYWYTGFRPETLAVQHGILRLAMPAASVGHEVESDGRGCQSPAIPYGVVQRVAWEAWRTVGRAQGADTVVLAVGKLEIEGRTIGGRVACGSGPAMMRLGPRELQQRSTQPPAG